MMQHQQQLKDPDYNPKSKSTKLSKGERCLILIGTFIFVIFLVIYRHPELLKLKIQKSKLNEKIRPTNLQNSSFRPNIHHRSTSLSGYATQGSSTTYLNSNSLKSIHRDRNSGLSFSKIGIGTYLGDLSSEVDKSIEETIVSGVKAGINVIDTSINYRGMKSERAIGKAISRLIHEVQVPRSSMFIASKAGFLPFDGDRKGSNSRLTSVEWTTEFAFINNEIIDHKHCIAKDCLQRSLGLTLANTRLETLDLLYLHNTAEKMLPTLSYSQYLSRIKQAFEYLESLRKQESSSQIDSSNSHSPFSPPSPMIRFYGLASWQCFRVPPTHPLYVSLQDLVHIAETVGGKETHGFRFIELPLTLSMPEAWLDPTQGNETDIHTPLRTALQEAEDLGLTVMSSRSIGMADEQTLSLAQQIQQTCLNPLNIGLTSSFLSSSSMNKTIPSSSDWGSLVLSLTQSIPGLGVSLVGMKNNQHLESNLRVIKEDSLNIPSSVMNGCVKEVLKKSRKTISTSSSSTLTTSPSHSREGGGNRRRKGEKGDLKGGGERSRKRHEKEGTGTERVLPDRPSEEKGEEVRGDKGEGEDLGGEGGGEEEKFLHRRKKLRKKGGKGMKKLNND